MSTGRATDEHDGKKGDTIMLFNGDDGRPKRGALCGSHKTVVPNCVNAWFCCVASLAVLFGGSAAGVKTGALVVSLLLVPWEVCVVGFSVLNRQFDDVACNGFRGAPEERAEEFRSVSSLKRSSPQSMRRFVANRQLGRMCTKKELWLDCESAADSTGGRAHSPTAMLWFILDSLMSAQKSSHWDKKRRHCLGPWSLTQPGAHLPGNELFIDCLSRPPLL